MEEVGGLLKTLEFNIVVPDTVSCLPIFTVPPIPTPPVTTKAPVVVEPEAVLEVTAKPDIDNISVDGLKENVLSLEIAEPDDDEFGVNVIKWLEFEFPALTILTLLAVVAVPESEPVIAPLFKITPETEEA